MTTQTPEELIAECGAWWDTAIIDIHPGKIAIRGYPIEDLIGRVRFPDMIWLMLRGDLPSRGQSDLLEAALVPGVDHGPHAPSIAISRMAVTCGLPVNGAMASAINVLDDIHGGAGQQCMELYREIDAEAGATGDLVAAATVVIQRHRAAGEKIVPGFGHRFHPIDPRTAPLFALVAKAEAAGVVSGRWAAIDLLTGTATYRRLVSEGASLESWIGGFGADIARFAPSRDRSLLYASQRPPGPVVLIVTGAHESGKTTVVVKIIEALAKEGLRVGSLKHTDHEYETDLEGKDSQRHKAAGAEPAVLVAGGRSAVHRQAHGPAALSVFLEGEYGLSECDVVIVEGFRGESLPKIEVCRAATGRSPLCENDPSVIAVVTDRPTDHPPAVRRFRFSEIPSLLLFLKNSPVFSSFLRQSVAGS